MGPMYVNVLGKLNPTRVFHGIMTGIWYTMKVRGMKNIFSFFLHVYNVFFSFVDKSRYILNTHTASYCYSLYKAAWK